MLGQVELDHDQAEGIECVGSGRFLGPDCIRDFGLWFLDQMVTEGIRHRFGKYFILWTQNETVGGKTRTLSHA